MLHRLGHKLAPIVALHHVQTALAVLGRSGAYAANVQRCRKRELFDDTGIVNKQLRQGVVNSITLNKWTLAPQQTPTPHHRWCRLSITREHPGIGAATPLFLNPPSISQRSPNPATPSRSPGFTPRGLTPCVGPHSSPAPPGSTQTLLVPFPALPLSTPATSRV